MGLDTVELVMAFEESFGISFPDADSEKLETPGLVIDYVVQRLRDKGEQPDREQVADIVRQCVIDQLGIHPKEYREDANFIRDLGAD